MLRTCLFVRTRAYVSCVCSTFLKLLNLNESHPTLITEVLVPQRDHDFFHFGIRWGAPPTNIISFEVFRCGAEHRLI